jgi:hypothetical protein
MTLIKHRIQTLMLNEFASFPSQVKDAKDMIKEWRRDQRCRLVVYADPRASGVSADSVPDGADDGLPLEGG